MVFWHPKHLQSRAPMLLKALGGTGFLAFAIGTTSGLFIAPADYLQGDMARVMYVHVPSSWMALVIYSLMAIFSFLGLIMRNIVWHWYCQALAPVGALFAFLSLVTGSIWGKPTWGTWWVWDARLTSMAILFFLYLGYLSLIHQISRNESNRQGAALMLIIGWVNIPIIKWSVDWWATLHQPASVFRLQGPSIDFSMLWPLFPMVIAWICYTGSFTILNILAIWQEYKQIRGHNEDISSCSMGY